MMFYVQEKMYILTYDLSAFFRYNRLLHIFEKLVNCMVFDELIISTNKNNPKFNKVPGPFF